MTIPAQHTADPSHEEADALLARLTAIVESSDDAIIGKTLDGTITSWNRGAEATYGYTAAEMIGTSIARLVPPDRPSEVDEILDQIRQGRPVEHFETVRRRKDGTLINVSLTVSPIREAQGQITGASAIARDISNRKQNEKEMERIQQRNAELTCQVEALEESTAELRLFVDRAANDLYKPLRSLLHYPTLIARDYGDQLDERGRKWLSSTLNGAQRLRRLICAISDYNIILYRNQQATPVTFNGVLEDALATLEDDIREAKARVIVSPLPELTGHHQLLVLLFQNLISNAIKYRSTERDTVISIHAVREPTEWVFSVEDNGIGMEEQYLTRIFGMGERLHTESQYPGWGFGLANCERIVRVHGGRIWAESKLGEGSTFRFTIPAD